MKAWRVMIALTCLLLSGCLVTFEDPIPANEAAPIPLLGEWTRKNEWGEQLYLEVSRAGSNLYKARTYIDSPDNLDSLEEFGFTVAHHGQRWYLSAGVPQELGGNFAIAGFELTADNELLLYNLDVERIGQEVAQGGLEGTPVETRQGGGVRVTSGLEQVWRFLDDPANADTFIEVARYRRDGQ
ncbi:MAG: hypothetical protein V4812_19625 [Pseudomonadota bacterium]